MHATLHHARALVAADPVTVTVGAGAVQKEKGYPSPEYMEQGKLWVPGRPYPFDPTGPSGAGPRRPKRPTSYSWGGSRHQRPGPAAEPGASAPPGAGGLRGPSCHSLHPPATSQGTKEGGPTTLLPHAQLLTTHESSRAAELAGQRNPSRCGGATVGSGSTSSLTARHFRGAIGSHAEVRLSGAMLSLSASKCG